MKNFISSFICVKKDIKSTLNFCNSKFQLWNMLKRAFCLHFFSSFRYGEYRQSIVNIVVHLKPKTTTTSSPEASSSSSSATGNPTASALTPNSFAKSPSVSYNATNQISSTSSVKNITAINAEEEFQRQFFILRVFVLGSIGCVFSTLVLMFLVYFMYLWRTWDSGTKRDQNAGGPSDSGVEFSKAFF